MNAPAGRPEGELAAWIAPARTAVLIIDMQVDFASPDGALGTAGLDLSTVPAALAAAERLAGAAREAGVLVVFPLLQTSPDTDSPAWRERRRRMGEGDAGGLCRTGSPGADVYGPRPEPQDLVVAKRKYSAFHGTPLDAELRRRGVDTLVVAGLTTECCVDCSVRDAFHLDYHVFIATDACAAYGEDLHRDALTSLEINCAILTDVASVEAAWETSHG